MKKNHVLGDLAQLIADHKNEIIQQNQLDLEAAGSLDATLVDRLKVDAHKVDLMIAAVEEVIGLDDPTGNLLSEYQHPNGMIVQNKVVPFGKILIIYESRPDVTIEAAISAFKAGNRILLKGGKEARHTNLYLVGLWHQALLKQGGDPKQVTYLDISREETQTLIRDNPERVDLIIPRGGEGLINYIRSNTNIPLLISGRGNNFVYIHEDADLTMASRIVWNGKKRLSVCNAIDKVLIHPECLQQKEAIYQLIEGLQQMGIQVYGDQQLIEAFDHLSPMPDESMYYEEFLAAKILLAQINTPDDAIQAINTYSGGHSAVIICENKDVAQQFQEEVDCAAVYHNASSRFTDGGQFGFGAEIAISTQKLHFRGPLGLAQLVTNKWFISGNGQIRE